MPILGPIDCEPDYISGLYTDPANELLLAEYALASGGLQLGMLTAGGASAGAGADGLLRITEGSQGGGGGGRIGCFRSFTSVLMADDTHRPIKMVMPGDFVWAFDSEGNLSSREVLAHFIYGRKNYRRVWTDDGKCVEVTEEHPFWQGDKFTPIGMLKRGDFVWHYKGEWKKSAIIRNDDIEDLVLVHNLEVEGLHTYIAGNIGCHNLKSPLDPNAE